LKVGVVLTGGTIGAELRGSALAVAPEPTAAELGLLRQAWPEPGEPRATIEVPLRALSENLSPRDWLAIAASVRRLTDSGEVDGVLVLHGTDTMAYTAAALSFLLSDLACPIVLTGASKPASEPGTDAPGNVRAALVALRALEAGTFAVFSARGDSARRVYLGSRLRKAGGADAPFASVNRPLVALVQDDELVPVEPYVHRVRERSRHDVDERVLALRLYPGLDFEAAHAAVARAGARGVVIELYASATGPDTRDRFSLPRFVERCAREGVLIVTAAPAAAHAGATYATSVAIAEAGGVFLADMLPEVAVVKLMWVLAQDGSGQSVAERMLTPVAGEVRAQGAPSR
jgi:glutamyl-tRNA(Gln) amidotransferase subunit D